MSRWYNRGLKPWPSEGQSEDAEAEMARWRRAIESLDALLCHKAKAYVWDFGQLRGLRAEAERRLAALEGKR